MLQRGKPATSAPMSHALTVDDEPSVASSPRLLPKRTGYQNDRASDGRAAPALFKSRSFDRALLDVSLGYRLLAGLAAPRAIRSSPAYAPAIMLTSGTARPIKPSASTSACRREPTMARP